MNDADKNQTTAEAAPKKALLPVRVVHLKTEQYKTLHADGVWGSNNNHGNLKIDFYVERPPFPSEVVFPLNPDGTVSNNSQEIYKEADGTHFTIIHEFQGAVVLSLGAAVQLQEVIKSYLDLSKQQLDEAMKARGIKNE